MFRREDGKEHKLPEELAMMPRKGWDSDSSEVKGDDQVEGCGMASCKPSFLQRFSGVWTFTIVVGLTSLGSEFMQFYLKSQVPTLERQYDLTSSTTTCMTYASEIACIVSVLFLSIFARRIHIPRVLAISSTICGIAGILCIIPYLATQGSIVPPPHVLKNETYSIEKFQMLLPVCSGIKQLRKLTGHDEGVLQKQRAPSDHDTGIVNMNLDVSRNPHSEERIISIPDFKKLQTHPIYPKLVEMSKPMGIDLEKIAAMDLDEQLKYLETLPPQLRAMLPNLKLMLGDNADSYFMNVTVDVSSTTPSNKVTITIPDFKKLQTHPIYANLVTMSKTMGIDLEKIAAMDLDEQLKYLKTLPPNLRAMLPNLKMMLGPNADSYFMNVTVDESSLRRRRSINVQDDGHPRPATIEEVKEISSSSVPEKTILIPDFKKLATHAKFPVLVKLSKTMNVDLELLATLDLDAQIDYLDKLPPQMREMLPQLKGFLGADADSYFIHVTVKDVPSDNNHTISSIICMSMDRETFAEAYINICPFTTGPFMVANSSTAILALINFAMVLQGVARAPRMAYGVTFLGDNTRDGHTVLHLAVLYGITFVGPLLSMVLGLGSTLVYISDADIGHMTFLNPRWLPAWWLGFVILAVMALLFALPLFMFPKKLNSRPTKKYHIRESCFTIATYVKELGTSLVRLVINPLYLALVASHLLSAFVWTGIVTITISYATHQFSLAPMIPGMILLLVFMFISAIGIFIGGIISRKYKMSTLGNLKFAFGLACGLLIISCLNLGFGCDQPDVDNGGKIVDKVTNATCSCACQCVEFVNTPGCGSDGITYQSPCHAGCTEGHDGKFHGCLCIDDDEQTLIPGHCPNCSFFIPFAISLCIGGLLAGVQFAPLLVATYRCVKPKDVPLSIGLRTLLLAALVAIPSPLVYTAVQDAQCLNRLPKCGIIEPCVLYDIESFRYRIFGLSLGMEALGVLMLLLALFMGKRASSIYYKDRYSTG